MAARPEVAALRARLDTSDRRNRFALAVAGYFVDPARALGLTPFVVKQSAEDAVWRSLGDYDLRPSLRGARRPGHRRARRRGSDPHRHRARDGRGARRRASWPSTRCGHVPYVEAPDALLPPLRRFRRADSG